jgi:hypothetical protein
MPIMASHGRSDARGTAQLLASMALDCIGNPASAGEQRVGLNNVYRLLQSYKSNRSFGLEPPPELAVRSATEKLTLRRPIERHVNNVRNAMEDALSQAFSGEPKERAIQAVESVLQSVAIPNSGQAPSAQDRERTVQFFEHFLQRLQIG